MPLLFEIAQFSQFQRMRLDVFFWCFERGVEAVFVLRNVVQVDPALMQIRQEDDRVRCLRVVLILLDVRKPVAPFRIERRVREHVHALLHLEDIEVVVEIVFLSVLGIRCRAVKQIVPNLDHVVVEVQVAVQQSVVAGEQSANQHWVEYLNRQFDFVRDEIEDLEDVDVAAKYLGLLVLRLLHHYELLGDSVVAEGQNGIVHRLFLEYFRNVDRTVVYLNFFDHLRVCLLLIRIHLVETLIPLEASEAFGNILLFVLHQVYARVAVRVPIKGRDRLLKSHGDLSTLHSRIILNPEVHTEAVQEEADALLAVVHRFLPRRPANMHILNGISSHKLLVIDEYGLADDVARVEVDVFCLALPDIRTIQIYHEQVVLLVLVHKAKEIVCVGDVGLANINIFALVEYLDAVDHFLLESIHNYQVIIEP